MNAGVTVMGELAKRAAYPQKVDEREQMLRYLEASQMSGARRLGAAVTVLTQELAATRRDLQALRRDNAELRRLLRNAGWGPVRGMSRNRENGILSMVRQEQRAGKA